jgi:LysM repeat protein
MQYTKRLLLLGILGTLILGGCFQPAAEPLQPTVGSQSGQPFATPTAFDPTATPQLAEPTDFLTPTPESFDAQTVDDDEEGEDEEGGEFDLPTATPRASGPTEAPTDELRMATPTALPEPTQNPCSHEVQAGDTLYRIAQQYGVDVNEMARINGLVDPDRLTIGQTLAIPGCTGEESAEGEAAQDEEGGEAASGGGTVTHIVESGENLFRISLNFNVTVDAIKRANGLTSNNIYVGQKLIIPLP